MEKSDWRSNSLSKLSLYDYLRSGSTCSLDEHAAKPRPMIPSRSSELLESRGPSYPCQTLDLSRELTEENKIRRNLHSRLFSEDPGVFHRKVRGESPSQVLIQQIKMKDLLGEMHKLKDEKDILGTKRFTYSRKSLKDAEDKAKLEDHLFNSLPPIEDFINPKDTTSPRSTGYEHGHIRTLFQLDTYGPAASMKTNPQRSFGRLPEPNVDRYAKFTPNSTNKVTGSRNLISSNSSRASTASTNSFSEPDFSEYDNFRDSRSNSFKMTVIPSSLRANTPQGPARITSEDRLNLDPFVRRKDYYNHLKSRKNHREEVKTFTQTVHKYQKDQSTEARVERRRIREFEKKLQLAKFEP